MFKIGIIVVVALVLFCALQSYLIGFTYIPAEKVGIVCKWWSFKGSVKDGGFIALNGEAGFQPDLLRAGIHFRPRIIYKVIVQNIVNIPQGKIGYVYARDGKALAEGQRLGYKVECNNFCDTRAFLANGGQKGTQITILREGVYPINTAAFVVITSNKTYSVKLSSQEQNTIEDLQKELENNNAFDPIVLDGEEDKVCIVTVHEGPALNGEIIAPEVGTDAKNPETYHNCFQNPMQFLKAGGYAGRQLQTITEGTYFINSQFATVETIPKTEVPIGSVGVVISFVGEEGADLSGEDYSHGRLVSKGFKGVWDKVLQPGKYPINTYAQNVVLVPTHNILLKWMEECSEDHDFDENLASVNLITKDAYKPTLPLSVVINIPYTKAPYVIQRFGDIQKLVEQTLDPMVAAYFKNAAQELTLIELIQKRADIQKQATEEMREKFAKYDLELVEVLIGTPNSNGDASIEAILKQLTDRQLSRESKETYSVQLETAKKEKELNQFKAAADMQAQLTQSQINIEIKSNQGDAEVEFAKRAADKTRTEADAEAYRTKELADAEATKVSKVGLATAEVAAKQVKAYGGPQYQVMQQVCSKFCEAIEKSGIELVPKQVVVTGSNGEGQLAIPTALDPLLTLLLTDKLSSMSRTETEEGTVISAKPSEENAGEEVQSSVVTPVSAEEEVEDTATEMPAIKVEQNQTVKGKNKKNKR